MFLNTDNRHYHSLIGVTSNKRIIRYVNLPTKGTASLVIGISSETIFIKTVRESITVTPTHRKYLFVE